MVADEDGVQLVEGEYVRRGDFELWRGVDENPPGIILTKFLEMKKNPYIISCTDFSLQDSSD